MRMWSQGQLRVAGDEDVVTRTAKGGRGRGCGHKDS